MKIAIGTTSEPKLQGVRSAIEASPYFTGKEIEYITKKVPSGISDMPLSIEETMQGAKNRALALVNDGIFADFYVGMEGGATRIGNKSYLFGTVFIQDSFGEGHFGISPMIEIPAKVEALLYDDGQELGPVMEELAGRAGSMRNPEGSMADWSDGDIVRRDEFETATRFAIPPFFNKYYKFK